MLSKGACTWKNSNGVSKPHPFTFWDFLDEWQREVLNQPEDEETEEPESYDVYASYNMTFPEAQKPESDQDVYKTTFVDVEPSSAEAEAIGFERSLEDALGYKMDVMRGKGYPLCRMAWFGDKETGGSGNDVHKPMVFWVRGDWIRTLNGIDAIYYDYLFLHQTSALNVKSVIVTGQPGIGMLSNST